MSSDVVLVLSAFGIGIVAGLRSMTAPAAVSWAAHLHRLDLRDSRLALLGSAAGAYMTSTLALGELIADKLPFVPNRTSPLPITFRMLSGAVCGAALCVSVNRLILAGTLLGGLGGVNGAFGGFHVRRLLVKYLNVPDIKVALAEDAFAIVAALFIISRF